MTSMRDAMLANPVLAQTIRQTEERRAAAAQRRALNSARAARDAAIAELVKARKAKKRVKPLLERVKACVARLRIMQQGMQEVAI